MWLYVPGCACCPSAPAAAGSTSPSSWRFRALARSVSWRGKDSPSRTWSARWGRVSWIRLLCGAMPEPSTAALGVASWIASLRDIPAPPSPSPASARAPATRGTCGPMSGASSSSAARDTSSSRMSARTCRSDSSRCEESYAAFASRSRLDYSQRRKWGRLTSASGSSSSDWPTPDAAVSNDGESPGTFLARRERVRAKGYNGNGMGTPLAMAAKISSAEWPTPNTVDPRGGVRNGGGQRQFCHDAERWVTPRARDWKSGEASPATAAKNARPLSEQALSTWSTPIQCNGERTSGANRTAILARWPTATVTDSRNGRNRTSRRPAGTRHHDGVTLSDAIALSDLPSSRPGDSSSRRGPPTSSDGAPCSPPTRRWPLPERSLRRSLNPAFVEWLMGWPIGWTACACSAEALSHYRAHMRCALSRLAPPPPAPPAQPRLFG